MEALLREAEARGIDVEYVITRDAGYTSES